METLQVAHRTACTEAEGPGRRYALWLQGCPLRCPGCCNPGFLPFHGGEAIDAKIILNEIRSAQAKDNIEGISLLGGEPTSQARGLAPLAQAVQNMQLSVMLYSGYTLEELHHQHDEAIAALLAATDILVDGRYERENPEHIRRWVGSANQKVHFLTERYRQDDPCWRQRNTIELRLTPESLSMNGFPTPAWRRMA